MLVITEDYMKLVRITMDLLVEDDTRADKWVFQTVADQLESGEDITDFDYQIIEQPYVEDLV